MIFVYLFFLFIVYHPQKHTIPLDKSLSCHEKKKKHQQYIVGKTKQKTIPTYAPNFSKEWVNVILDLQIKDDIKKVAYLNKDDPSGGGKSGPRCHLLMELPSV